MEGIHDAPFQCIYSAFSLCRRGLFAARGIVAAAHRAEDFACAGSADGRLRRSLQSEHLRREARANRDRAKTDDLKGMRPTFFECLAMALRAPLPSGAVTLLFTAIEGSTQHWEEQPRNLKTVAPI